MHPEILRHWKCGFSLAVLFWDFESLWILVHTNCKFGGTNENGLRFRLSLLSGGKWHKRLWITPNLRYISVYRFLSRCQTWFPRCERMRRGGWWNALKRIKNWNGADLANDANKLAVRHVFWDQGKRVAHIRLEVLRTLKELSSVIWSNW